MNDAIVYKQNLSVSDNDDYYILGDVALDDINKSKEWIKKLNGRIHLIRGNHDSDIKINFYKSLGWDIHDALLLKYNKFTFYLSHYPAITCNPGDDTIKQAVINLYGHTHQTTNFYYDYNFNYHVGVDSHNCEPMSIDDIIGDIKSNLIIKENLNEG